jgi:hypothetical protein
MLHHGIPLFLLFLRKLFPSAAGLDIESLRSNRSPRPQRAELLPMHCLREAVPLQTIQTRLRRIYEGFTVRVLLATTSRVTSLGIMFLAITTAK